MTLLKDIIKYLTSLGIIQGDGVDAYRDIMPDIPDNVVSLYEYKGDPALPHTEAVHRSVQVVVRNKSAASALAKAMELCNTFRKSDEAQRIDFTPTRWGQVHVRNTPIKIKQDERGRTQCGFNLGITTIIKQEE